MCRVGSQYTAEVQKGCQWLVDHRLSDGGWGENFESCELKEYVAAERSQVVQTGWALLALMAVRSVALSLNLILAFGLIPGDPCSPGCTLLIQVILGQPGDPAHPGGARMQAITHVCCCCYNLSIYIIC